MKKLKLFGQSIRLLWSVARKGVLFTTAATIVLSFEATILTLITVDIIELIQHGNKSGRLWQDLMILVVYFILRAFFSALNQLAVNGWLFESANANLKVKLHQKVSGSEIIEFEKAGFLDEIRKCTEIVEEESLPLAYYKFLQLMQNVLSFASLAVVLGSFHPVLPLCLIIICVPVLITRLTCGKAMFSRKMSHVKENRKMETYRSWFHSPRYNKELRATSSSGYILEKWQALDTRHRKELTKEKNKDALSAFLCELLRTLTLVGVSLFTVWAGLNGLFSAAVVSGALIAYFSAQNEATLLFEKLGSMTELLYMNEVLLEFLQKKDPDKNKEVVDFIREITLNDVTFSYPGSSIKAIDGLNLSIKQNEVVAVVGVNGSGKTTLGKLLLNIYPPDKGQLSINGKKIESLNQESFWSRAAMVPQVIPRFKCLVREYLFLDPDGSQDEKASGFLDRLHLTSCFEHGLDERLGVEFGGVELSGGQWQSLSIAAAWMKNADFYVLDEATAAIDPIKETEILNYFLEMVKDKMAVIITHRLSICRKVDRIIYMENGKILEDGSHDELMKLQGKYYQMYTSQMENSI